MPIMPPMTEDACAGESTSGLSGSISEFCFFAKAEEISPVPLVLTDHDIFSPHVADSVSVPSHCGKKESLYNYKASAMLKM